ncbi:MAG: hypothetical protein ACOVQ2_06735 [Flavobacterium sp.]
MGVAGRLAPAMTIQKTPKWLGLPGEDRRHFALFFFDAITLS